jgi:hypothetical protein
MKITTLLLLALAIVPSAQAIGGTYLAACTFYAALHRQNPEGLSYTAGLDPDDAAFLQRVAWDTVEAYSARNMF